MSFKEKIDKLLKVNTLKINSVYGLERFIGASVGSVRKYYEQNAEPGLRTIKKIQEALSVNQEWWSTGKGEIFIEKLTSVQEKAKKEDDVLDHPLVKSYVDQINQLNKLVEILERENAK